MSKTKGLSPQDNRFTWSYNHDHCFDSKTKQHWIRHIHVGWFDLPRSFTYETDDYEFKTFGCTRKQTAIRALMRLINRMDNGKC